MSCVTSRIVAPCSFASACIRRRPRGRDAVERGGGLVGQHDGWIAHQRPGDRDTLSLPTREFVGALVDVRARPTASSIERARRRSSPRGSGGGPEPELDVLGRRQRGEQVVLLKMKPMRRRTRSSVPALAPFSSCEHSYAARLRGAQCADQRQQRCLARARRSVTMMISRTGSWPTRRTGSGGAARPCRSGGRAARRRRVPPRSSEHSAGSSLRTLRNARNPDSAQTASMMPNTSSERLSSCASGSRVGAGGDAVKVGRRRGARDEASTASIAACCSTMPDTKPLR